MSLNTVLKAKTASSGYYNVIALKNVENVIIRGGKIVGEKDTHIGSEGEFGFGIIAYNCQNIHIEFVNLSMYYCFRK